MMKNKIYILSEPIQSGKTTLIYDWAKRIKHVGGFLTPDVNGMRKLLDLSSGNYYNLQLPNDREGIKIGRYVFDEKVFLIAQDILKTATYEKYSWFVVDEIGRLEIKRLSGLEPMLGKIIHDFKTTPYNTKLLLVIRDYLLADAILHYGITNFELLKMKFFKVKK